MSTYQRYLSECRVPMDRERRLFVRYNCKAYDVLGTWDGTIREIRAAAPCEFAAWRAAYIVQYGTDPAA